MKVYSSKFYSCQEEYEEVGSEEVTEVTIVCNIEELERLTNFFKEELESITNYLNKIKNESKNIDGETVYCHSHYRDRDKKWKKGTPDFIIAVEAK